MSKPTEQPKVSNKKTKVVKKRKSRKGSAARKRALLKANFVAYFSQLPIQKLAAASIGVSEDAICDWKNNDKKFANQIESAKSAWALEKSNKVKSVEWLLERIMNEHFGEKIKVEETNKNLEEFLDRAAKLLPD